MLCIRGTSHGPVSVCVCLSVCLSLTSRCSTKTAKRIGSHKQHHTITQRLVFWCQRSTRHSTGVTPLRGSRMLVGWVKISDFWQITGYISKTAKDRASFLLRSNRKSYGTLSNGGIAHDLERPRTTPSHPIFAFGTAIHSSVTGNLETSNLVHWLTIASPTLPMKNLPWKGRGQGQLTRFRCLHPM